MPAKVITDASLIFNGKYINESYWYILKGWNCNGYIDIAISKNKEKLKKKIETCKDYDKFLIDFVLSIQ